MRRGRIDHIRCEKVTLLVILLHWGCSTRYCLFKAEVSMPCFNTAKITSEASYVTLATETSHAGFEHICLSVCHKQSCRLCFKVLPFYSITFTEQNGNNGSSNNLPSRWHHFDIFSTVASSWLSGSQSLFSPINTLHNS